MPWTCKQCETTVLDTDSKCPKCANQKSSWTLVAEATRTFTVARRKVVPMHGAAGAAPSSRDLIDARFAPAIAKADAQRLSEAKQAPPEADVLTVRLFPKGKTDWTVVLNVNFEEEEVREDEFPCEAPADFPSDGAADIRFLLVYGSDEVDTAALTIQDVDHVVDITEVLGDETVGHAPTIEVAAPGIQPKPKLLPVGGANHYLSVRLFDRTGLVPLANRGLKANGQAVTTDARGVATLERQPATDLLLELDEGSFYVPAVHDPTLCILKPLPFVEASDEEIAAAWQALDDESDAEGETPGDDDADEGLAPHLYPESDGHEEDDEEEEEDDDEEERHHDVTRNEDSFFLLSARIVDRNGLAVADTQCVVSGITAQTDGNGVLSVTDLEPGYHELIFEGGSVWASATHHPEFVTRVHLPFLISESEDDEEDGDDEALEDDDEREVPEWVGVDPDADDVEDDDDDMDDDDLEDADMHGLDAEDFEELAALLE